MILVKSGRDLPLFTTLELLFSHFCDFWLNTMWQAQTSPTTRETNMNYALSYQPHVAMIIRLTDAEKVQKYLTDSDEDVVFEYGITGPKTEVKRSEARISQSQNIQVLISSVGGRVILPFKTQDNVAFWPIEEFVS